MSTSAIEVEARAAATHEAARSIYVFMAVLFVVVAVTGFAPRSLAIVTGARPVPPLIVHLHAATMSAWLVLLLTQSLLNGHRTPSRAQVAGHGVPRARAGHVPGHVVARVARILRPAQSADRAAGQCAWQRSGVPDVHHGAGGAAVRRVLCLGDRGTQVGARDLYQLALLVPVLLYEVVRFGRVHWTYVLGIGLFLTSALGAHLAWNSPAWQQLVAGWLGA